MMRLLVFPALALASVPAGYLAAAAQDPGAGIYLVLAPPWHDAEALIAAAGGWAVGPDAAPFGRFAASYGPDFPTRAREFGLMVLDGRPIADFCGTNA
jgi:hypothetical protein